MPMTYRFFPLCAVLIWSSNTVVSKMSAGLIDPSAMSFYRWLLAGVVMTPFCLRDAWRLRHQIRPYVWKIVTLALVGMVLYQSLAYFAAATSSATSMGMIAALTPLVTILLSGFLLDEVPTWGTVSGGVLSLAGLVILMSQGHPARLLTDGVVFGDLLMLVAAIAYAFYGVLLKRWALPLNVWHLLFLQIWSAVIMLLPLYLHAPPAPVTNANLPLILYAGIIVSIGAQFLWINGIAYMGASRATMFINLSPVFTVMIAMLALGETMHVYHAVGGGITLAGVVLAQVLKQPIMRRAI